MANPVANITRYIAGGRGYFTPYENGAFGAEFEIGEIKDFSLKVGSTTKEAMSQDTGPELSVEEVNVAPTAEVSFSTQNLNKENRAMAHMGTLTTETFAIGATLPDGTTATEETVIDKIVGLDKLQLRGQLRIVSAPINGEASGKRPVLIVYMCSVRPSGDNNYIVTEYTKLPFSGKAQKTANGFYDEYIMDAA